MAIEVVLGILVFTLVNAGKIRIIRLHLGRYLDSRAVLIFTSAFLPLTTKYTVVHRYCNGTAHVGKSDDNAFVCPQSNTKRQPFINKKVHSYVQIFILARSDFMRAKSGPQRLD